jgi:RNA polymerase sigma factor (sigma-70 family)
MTESRSDQPGGFPLTQHSQVLAARSPDPEVRARSLEALTLAYYRAVYKYVRIRWRRPDEDAREITHDFFATAYEKGTFARFDPDKARFRTYVRVCLDRFIAKRDRDQRALKRGGNAPKLSLDFDAVERDIEQPFHDEVTNPEAWFTAEWMRYLIASSVEALRERATAKGKSVHFAVFERLDLCADPDARPSYAEVAGELGISVTDVTNRLSWARRELRKTVIDKLAEITATEDELRSEAFAVLGVRL